MQIMHVKMEASRRRTSYPYPIHTVVVGTPNQSPSSIYVYKHYMFGLFHFDLNCFL